MNQLVFIDNGQPVTDSLMVAEVFGKEHDKVLRDIRELECSPEFSLANFGESTYTNDRGRQYPRYIITQDGFSFLVMGYTGKEAAQFKENYISEFSRMRQQLQPSSIEDLIIMQAQAMKDMRQRVDTLEVRTNKAAETVKEIRDTFLLRDEDWRDKINGLLNGATRRRGNSHKEMRTLSYQILEDRAHCDLNRRLTNLKDRLRESGATKTKVEDANRLDVIEGEPRLKEIYTTIVKELSIGAMN